MRIKGLKYSSIEVPVINMRVYDKEGRNDTDGEAVGEVVQPVAHNDHPRRWRYGRRRQTMAMMIMMVVVAMIVILVVIMMMMTQWLSLLHDGVLCVECPTFQTAVCAILCAVWL